MASTRAGRALEADIWNTAVRLNSHYHPPPTCRHSDVLLLLQMDGSSIKAEGPSLPGFGVFFYEKTFLDKD